jgi:acyl phosphate:glycerol-3-phosphate acyltransferase
LPAIALNLLIVAAASYLLGSFPTGVIAGLATRGIDIRGHGSGNTGATNSFRVLGWKAGLVVALVDIGKGYLAVALLSRLAPFPAPAAPAYAPFMVSSLAAALGHVKPVFAGFKGGKGFGTAAGSITAAYPILAPFCLAVFLATLVLSGYVAVCAAVTALALPLIYLAATRLFALAYEPAILAFFVLVAALTILGVRRKLGLYLRGEAELFEKVMVLKRRKGPSRAGARDEPGEST